MSEVKPVLYGDMGMSQPDPKITVYEQTSTSPEYVKGRIGMRGSSDKQVKLFDGGANSIPLCVFIEQTSYPGLVVADEAWDSDYAANTQPVDQRAWGIFPFRGLLLDGESVTKGQKGDAAALGKLIAHVAGGNPCVMFLETKSASGSDEEIECLWLPGFPEIGSLAELKVVTETVTVAANVGTLANTPQLIEYVEMTTQTGALGNLLAKVEGPLAPAAHVVTLAEIPEAFLYVEATTGGNAQGFKTQVSAIAVTLCVQVTKAAKTLTFLAGDAVSAVYAAYLYYGGAKTSAKIIVSGTVRQGEVKVDYSAKTLTFNATDAVTEAKCRYWYAD